MSTRTEAPQRPQRLVRVPTNPMAAARPAPSAATTSPDVSTPQREGGVRPIESIAVDLEGAPRWRLAVIAASVALVVVVALFAGA